MLVIAYAVSLRAHLQRTVVSTELEALLPNWECDQVRRMDSAFEQAFVCVFAVLTEEESTSIFISV